MEEWETVGKKKKANRRGKEVSESLDDNDDDSFVVFEEGHVSAVSRSSPVCPAPTYPPTDERPNSALDNPFFRDSQQRGFYALSQLESDSFEDEEPVEVANTRGGKRNRQISTDSSSSAVAEIKDSSKSKKKPKKKERKKQPADDEIDRILTELDQCNKPSVAKEGSVEPSSAADSSTRVGGCKNKKKQPVDSEELLDGESLCQTNVLQKKSGRRDSVGGGKIATNSAEAVDQGEGKKDRRRPGKKQLAAIQAVLQEVKENEERLVQEEMVRQKKAEEMEQARLEKLRLEQEKRDKKKQKEKQRKERLKAEGKLLTKAQKAAKARVEAALNAWREHGIKVPNVGGKASAAKAASEATDDALHQNDQLNEGVDSENFNKENVAEPACEETKGKTINGVVTDRAVSCRDSKTQLVDGKRKKRAVFRSPIVCVLGHVDTGKTKILDYIRKTNVQDNEAGGITQQIGATMVPAAALREKCTTAKGYSDFELRLPGLLIIDTPGHESFRNLRSRGSSLCDIAVLVVDIMQGLEKQTLESIHLLKQRKTPFVVALNKIDRLYQWQTDPTRDIADVLRCQQPVTTGELDKRCKQVIAEFAMQNLNAALFFENTDPRSFISLVPVSAVSGDGMANLMAVLSQLCQKMLAKRLTVSEELEASVLEVKAIEGLGTTIDVILANGRLREGDTIVLAGYGGPVVTQIRSLLMPRPLNELRVKNPYREFRVVRGAQGVKVTGKSLQSVIAGLPFFVSRDPDDIWSLKEKANRLYRNTLRNVRVMDKGVYVQASTLGSLEALLSYLNTSSIPFSGVKVGPVVKKDVVKASAMLEHDTTYATILAFDVKVERDAQELAVQLGVKILQADIIYHLFDDYIAYKDDVIKRKLENLRKSLVYPCTLEILPLYVFRVRNPIMIGVRVTGGVLKVGTPLCVPSKKFLSLGTVTAIEVQHQEIESARAGDDVCIKIQPLPDDQPKTYDKDFGYLDTLVSKLNRPTLNMTDEFLLDNMLREDFDLIVELKKLFKPKEPTPRASS